MSPVENSEKEGGRSTILKKKRDKVRSNRGPGLQALRKQFDARRLGRDKPAGEKVVPQKLKMKFGSGSINSRPSDTSANRDRDFAPKQSSDKKLGKPAADPVKKRRHRLILQDDSDDDDYEPHPVVPSKDMNPSTSTAAAAEGKEGVREIEDDSATLMARDTQQAQGVRKSSRVPKRKVMEDFEGDLPDKEMANADDIYGEAREDGRVEKGDAVGEKDAGPSVKGTSVSDDDEENFDEDYGGPESKGQRSVHKPKMQDTAAVIEKGRNVNLTARQRTMQLGKDGDPEVGSNLIEFPTGLTHSSRRTRQKLPEAERLVKNAEAANRRKQLAEKAAKEIQATAIQKILGQDSSRKRKEDKQQKQREEIEQGRKAAALEPATNSVRWTMGPQGTTVSWSRDVELPSMFQPASSVYPPPREKCSAPTCDNPYKYRDSKCRMPLCSLKCYNEMQSTVASGSAEIAI